MPRRNTDAHIRSGYEVQPNGCWLWMRSRNNCGYGQTYLDGRHWLAHRYFYTAARGPIPDGFVLDHLCHTSEVACAGGLCDHRACVNPDHLEIVTTAENNRRNHNSKSEKPVCKRGHAFAGENLRIGPTGLRICRACERLRHSKTYRQARGATSPADR